METSGADVRFPAQGGEAVGAFLARPAGSGPWPAVVVVHGDSAPGEQARGVCLRFAAEGFVAMAPDLAADAARAVGDLAAAAGFLRHRPEVRPGAVGAVGFGPGGTLAFDLACEEGAVRACVDFYGPRPGPRGNLDRAGDLRCPLLGVFGALDGRIPLADVLSLKEALGARGFVVAYPRAGHGFMDDAGPAYREEDAKDAWRRTLLFLRETLAPDLLPPDAAPAVPRFRPGKGKARRGE